MPEMRGPTAVDNSSVTLQTPQGQPYPVVDDSLPISGSAGRQARNSCVDVLLVGRDLSLQRTRASLLEKAGFRCHSAGPLEMVLSMAQNRFDLVVFCHTLPVADARQAAEDIRLRFPSTRVLRLARYLQAEEECFKHLLVLPSPGEFVAMVQHLSRVAGRAA